MTQIGIEGGLQELIVTSSQQSARKWDLQSYKCRELNSSNHMNKLRNRFFPEFPDKNRTGQDIDLIFVIL